MNSFKLIYDYETYSELDVKKVGACEYSMHPSTEIMCAAWRLAREENLRRAPVRRWSPYLNDKNEELREALQDPKVVKVAHNAAFERMISSSVLFGDWLAPASEYRCTAAQAAALALPRKLEDVCEVLTLPFQKDMEGHRLMLKLCKPRKPTKNNPATRHKKMSDLLRVMNYNEVDVLADTELFLTLPPLSDFEQRLWELDQEINTRGFLADREMVLKVIDMIRDEKKLLNAEAAKISKGALNAATQRDAVLRWLKWNGLHLPNLQAKTVQDAIKDGLAEKSTLRMLEIRQAVSKTSTAKYTQFELRSRTDGRCRDGLMYWGASTGRWTGKGLQPHNFPQGKGIGDLDFACDTIKEGDLELVRLLYGHPIDTFSTCLRSVICAPKGKKLFVGDYAGIELRVLFWIAGYTEGLEAIREGKNLYIEMAGEIYNREIIKERDVKEYDVGKRAVLGCGFGMGWEKFQSTCEQYGNPVTDTLAKKAVNTYRSLYDAVPSLWKDIENAAIKAVRKKGQKFKTHRTEWFVEDDFLWCKLPSGRKLAYYKPNVKFQETSWGDKRPVLYHWSVNSTTKKWYYDSTYGGKLTENVVQATARDVMAYSMLPLEAQGFKIVLTVHDEILAECQDHKDALEIFIKTMSKVPWWASGLPIKVEAWNGHRYRK